VSRWGELIPHNETLGVACLCGCNDERPDTSVRRYRSPLGEVEAIHWTGPETSAEVFDFAGWRHSDDVKWGPFFTVTFATLDAEDARYSWGEWIVKDAHGRIHGVKPETFAAEYEALPGERSEP
jgi:hypothetical protein